MFPAKRGWFARLSELFQLVESSFGEVDVSVTNVSKDSMGLGVRGPKPGSLTVFSHLVKEREMRIRKLEGPAYVWRFFDNRLAE